MNSKNAIEKINYDIINCKKCPRLLKYIKTITKTKVKRFQNENYWGKPLPGFGDIKAELLIIGLAPAAHGGNRTGRMFTGDSSGDWLAKILFEYDFATKPTSKKIEDGFFLKNTYITAAVRCAPPQNKPLRKEFENCFPYLEKEFDLLKNVKVIICLGRIAFDTCCRLLVIKRKKFSHGEIIKHNNVTVVCSYHPSRQNTNTGRLTWKQWSDIFKKTKKIL